jgi:hypothetical protein
MKTELVTVCNQPILELQFIPFYYFLGLKLHITDIYLEELAKIGGITLKPKRLILLLSPFFNIIKTSDK